MYVYVRPAFDSLVEAHYLLLHALSALSASLSAVLQTTAAPFAMAPTDVVQSLPQ
jgi:hypothetical protein